MHELVFTLNTLFLYHLCRCMCAMCMSLSFNSSLWAGESVSIRHGIDDTNALYFMCHPNGSVLWPFSYLSHRIHFSFFLFSLQLFIFAAISWLAWSASSAQSSVSLCIVSRPYEITICCLATFTFGLSGPSDIVSRCMTSIRVWWNGLLWFRLHSEILSISMRSV